LKKKQKKENTWKIKKQNFKTEKNRKQNKWEKKGTSKRGKNGKKWTCPFALFLLFRFAFFLLFFLAFCLDNKIKTKKNKQKANRKKQKKTKNMQMDKSIFPHFFTLFDVPFFSYLLCFLFFLF
jgi:heme/copper-type cytochrome/quinol oxidase subunit 3